MIALLRLETLCGCHQHVEIECEVPPSAWTMPLRVPLRVPLRHDGTGHQERLFTHVRSLDLAAPIPGSGSRTRKVHLYREVLR